MKLALQSLAICLIILFVCACKKDEQKSYKTINTHRLKQYTSYTNGRIERMEIYTYEGDNLVSRSFFSKNLSDILEESNKAEISYEGDKCTLLWFSKTNGRFVKNYKKEYILSNYLFIQENDYYLIDESWVKDWQISFQYSGNNISTWQSYDNIDGIFTQTSKGEYNYTNNKVSVSYSFVLNSTKDWVRDDKETYTYEEGNITEWIDYSLDNTDTWRNSSKVKYTYIDGLVNQEDLFYWDNSNQEWILKNTTLYTYNENGYVLEKNDTMGNRTIFEYEEGNGNLSLFWYYPDDFITGSPTIKSALINKITNRLTRSFSF